jgi:hypothetical protein
MEEPMIEFVIGAIVGVMLHRHFVQKLLKSVDEAKANGTQPAGGANASTAQANQPF